MSTRSFWLVTDTVLGATFCIVSCVAPEQPSFDALLRFALATIGIGLFALAGMVWRSP